MVFDAILYPCHEILQIGLHLLGNGVRVEAAIMGIADDGRLAVVGVNDDKAVLSVEDIECSKAFVCSISGDKLCVVGSHKLDGDRLRRLQGDGMGC